MKSMLLAATLGAVLAAPLAHAQQSSRSPDPADPGATVPQLAFESAMTGYSRQAQDSGVTPDKNWRQLNDALAAGPAHDAHGEHGAKQAETPVQRHVPAAAPAKPAQPAEHQHH